MIINKKSENKKLKNNILALSAEATKAKKNDPSVINATSGMFKNEDGSLYEFSCVKDVISSFNATEKFAYSGTTGTPLFKEAVIRSIFGQFYQQVIDNIYLDCAATPGGTGALNLAFTNYVNAGETVLFPNYMWPNYLAIAEELNFVADTYNLFDKNHRFDLNDLNNKINELKNKQQRIVIVINDPCHNPTGFSLSDDDYDALIDIAKNNPNNDFVFLMDIAYFDFYSADANAIRYRFAKLVNIPNNALAFFAYSGSKSFGLYGLRIGALVALSKNQKEIEAFNNASAFSCRTTWSNSSALGVNVIAKVLTDDKYNQSYQNEIKEVCSMLMTRSQAFLDAAKEVNLETLPYERGFFICVPCNNPEKVMNALYEDKVYVICAKDCVRIALCAISKEEASRLPKIIKNRLDLMSNK